MLQRLQEEVADNFDRIQHFDLELSALNVGMLDKALPKLAPNLRSLTIECDDHDEDYDSQSGDEWSPSLDHFLYHGAPALESLSLHLIQFPWGVHLTRLKILHLATFAYKHEVLEDDLASYDFEFVVDTLRAASNLRVLELYGDIHSRPPLDTPKPIIDSSLRVLSLEGAVPCIGPLLAAYKANPGMYAELISDEPCDELEWDPEPQTPDDELTPAAVASDILPSHLTSRGSGGPPEFTAFHLVYRGFSSSISLRLGFDPVTPSDPLPKTAGDRAKQPSINVEITPRASHYDDPTSIQVKTLKLARSVTPAQLGHIRHLTLSGLCWPRDDVIAFFGNMNAVESLAVYALANQPMCGDVFERDAVVLLAHLLSTPASDEASGSDRDRVLLLPTLKNLYVSRISFEDTIQCDGDDVALDTAVTSGLTKRQQSGCGLRTVHLEDCRHVKESVFDLWAGIVPRVTSTSASQ